MTSNSNNGRPPASRAGAKPANGNGRTKGNADQGDLWSDAPAKPSVSPPPEAIGETRPAPQVAKPPPPAVAAAQHDATPTETTTAAASDLEATRAEDTDILDSVGAPATLPATEPAPSLDDRPNLLETVPLIPFAEPDVEEEYDDDQFEEDDYGEGYYYRDDEMSLLRNPYVLAGLAVALAIVMAVAVVFLFGRGGTGDGGNNGAATLTQTPSAGGGAVPGGLGARSVATATVREGPDLDYLELGLLRANQDVQVVGRNQDGSWYQIVYPRDSQLRGWVPKSAVSVPEAQASALVVVTVTPIQRPTVIVPTSTPRPADPTPEPEATPSPGQRVDIGVIIAADCAPNSLITLAISNQGTVSIDHSIQVIVTNNSTVQYDEVFAAKIAPGQTVPLTTDVRAKAPSMTVTVLLQGVQDVSASNNIASCSVSGSPGGGNNGGGTGNNGGGTNVPPPIGTSTN